MLNDQAVAELCGVPSGTIRQWVARAVLTPESRAGWNMAEALAASLYAATMRTNRTSAEASAIACSLTQAMGTFAALVLKAPHQVAGAQKLVAVVAELQDGEVWHRVVTTDADLQTLLVAIQRRGIAHLQVIDHTELHVNVLEAFQAVRTRDRVPA